jgi:hypothetical protein
MIDPILHRWWFAVLILRIARIRRQIAIPDSATADFLVSRALLRFGRS